MRSTCRYLNSVCAPVLYRDVDLFLRKSDSLGEINRYILQPHALHVTTLILPIERWSAVIRILTACKNLRSLNLHFSHDALKVDFFVGLPKVFESIIQLIQNGRLTSLGLYSQESVMGGVNRDKWEQVVYDISGRLLDAILDSPEAANALQVLDLAIPCMTVETYDRLRAGFKNLRSISFRQCLHTGLGKIWDLDQQHKWHQNPNLTRLYFQDCGSAAAFHVPGLVKNFPSLEELYIIACGNSSHVPKRSSGWSSLPDALCNVRPPLHTLYIEHMDEQEIKAMGIIPVINLSILSKNLLKLLIDDPEIFPGLGVLRMYSGRKQVTPGIKYEGATLESLCQAREVKLLFDLPANDGCGPSCRYL